MTEILRRLMTRFVKSDLIKDKKATDLLKVCSDQLKSDNYLAADKINIGSYANKLMKEMKSDKELHSSYKGLCIDIVKLLQKCVSYLANKLPLSNTLLKNVACFSPICRQEPQSLQMFLSVVGQLPYCTLSVDTLRCEWQQYQAEDIPEDFYCLDKGLTLLAFHLYPCDL